MFELVLGVLIVIWGAKMIIKGIGKVFGGSGKD